LGDVDDDTYGDIAVGAPYNIYHDDTESGSGAVYIYYGSPSGLQALRQPQVIRALAGARGLGISLLWIGAVAGPSDSSGGGGRLVIGAHESNSVVSVSKRPVVRLVTGKGNSGPSSDL
jgi:hypothetical protein